MTRRYWSCGLLLIACAALFLSRGAVAAAVDSEDPAAIRAAIEAAVAPRLAAIKNARVDVDVGAIDPRLRFPACPALSVTLPPADAATISARVTCATAGWVLYVPVRLHAWVEAVVAAANLAPNRILRVNDLTRGRVDLFAAGGGLLTDPRQAEGKILRTGLSLGTPILSPFLDQPIAVRRGQKVVLTLRDPMMTIQTTALVLEDGRIGDNVSVENAESRKTLRATVDSEGGVELTF